MAPFGRRWPWFAVVGCVVAAVAVTATLLVREPPADPRPGPFPGYTLTTTGGVAGIRHMVQVDADGRALFADEDPVAGTLPARTIARLRTLLADGDLADEGNRHDPNCADGFTYTLQVRRLTVSRYECGTGAPAPLFDEIRSLTSRERLRPLPADVPAFRGLRVRYWLLDDDLTAKMRVTPAGRVTVDRSDAPVRRGELAPRTLDAYRLLYAEPLRPPTQATGVDCVPEQVPTYKITPTGRRTTTASVCRLDDVRWHARLQLLRNEIYQG